MGNMVRGWEQRSPTTTRVLLAGGSPGTRRALGELLTARPGIGLAGATTTLLEAADAAVQARPDVVLMDVRLPDVRAVLASRTIRTHLPACHTLLLSTVADFRSVLAAMLSGASGVVLKSLDPTPLQEAIEAAGQGQMRLHPRIAEGVLEWFRERTVTSGDHETRASLSNEDLLLLANIAAGRLDGDITLETGRSSSDIPGDVARLYEALHSDRGFLATGNALAQLLAHRRSTERA
jgi:DNA-binding NarL/FixJ family response regulator